MNNKLIRQLAINLLDDQHGITDAAFQDLKNLAGGHCEDIFAKTECAKGRHFLNEDHCVVA